MLDSIERGNAPKDLYKTLLENLPEFLKFHYGKFVILGKSYPPEFYDNYETAASRGIELYDLENPFLVQRISRDLITNYADFNFNP